MSPFRLRCGLAILFCASTILLSHRAESLGSSSDACPVASSWGIISRDLYHARLLDQAAAQCQADPDCDKVRIDWEKPPRRVAPEEAQAYAKQLRDSAMALERRLPNPSPVAIMNWDSGDEGRRWSPAEKEVMNRVMNALADHGLRNWIAKNVHFERDPSDDISPISAGGTKLGDANKLRVKDDFFTSATTTARRENLLAFEAGKVFWVVNGLTYPVSKDVAGAMKTTLHPPNGESLSGTFDPDAASDFGHVFRAQAFRFLIPQEDKGLREKWETEICEFEKRVKPFL
jgi:hypothetical protein